MSVEDCKKIIDNKSSDEFFIDAGNFNPTTLFRDANYEKYLLERPKTSTKSAQIPSSANVGSSEAFEEDTEVGEEVLTPREELWQLQRRRMLYKGPDDDHYALSQEEAERMAELTDLFKDE
jgi:hypothetical protein